MYATTYTYVSTRTVYQMHHTELLTVDPLLRPAEATLERNHCITIFVVNQAEDRWRMLPVGLSKQTLGKNNWDRCTKYTRATLV
jgi:hypothetical protein